MRRPRFDSSLFRFFRFKSRSGEVVMPSAKILNREVVVPGETVRAALRLGHKERAIHLSRVRMIDSEPVLSEEIWVPGEGFEPLAKLGLDDFGDLR